MNKNVVRTKWLRIIGRLRPLRFALVGGFATLVHIGFAAFLLRIMPEAEAIIVNIIAFIPAFFVSFLGHRYFTFGTKGSVLKFICVALTGFLLNNVILSGVLYFETPKLLAIVFSTAVVPLLTYLASSLWVFEKSTR